MYFLQLLMEQQCRWCQNLLEAGVKVIDLAADFRIKDPAIWEHWYKQEHACPDVLQTAVYGLPELHREEIKNAQLVANPGCYPTAVPYLGFLPLLNVGMVLRKMHNLLQILSLV